MDIYQREFLALRDRLHTAEQESLKRSKELNLVLEEIKRAVSERQALREGEGNRTWGRLTGMLQLDGGWMEVCRPGLFSGPAKSNPSLSQPPRGSATEAVERLAQARASSAHRLPPSTAPAGQGEQPAARSASGPGPHRRYGRGQGGARGGQRGCPRSPVQCHPSAPLQFPW